MCGTMDNNEKSCVIAVSRVLSLKLTEGVSGITVCLQGGLQCPDSGRWAGGFEMMLALAHWRGSFDDNHGGNAV